MKPLNNPIMLNKRRNKVAFWHPKVKATLEREYWPVTVVQNHDGTYRAYKKLTGRGD